MNTNSTINYIEATLNEIIHKHESQGAFIANCGRDIKEFLTPLAVEENVAVFSQNLNKNI